MTSTTTSTPTGRDDNDNNVTVDGRYIARSSLPPLPEMPLLPITSPQTLLACRNLTVTDHHDIFVCSYPKSGTTWTQNLVVQLLASYVDMKSLLSPLPRDSWHLSHSAPFYEVDQYWTDDMIRIPAQTPIRGTLSFSSSTSIPSHHERMQQHDATYRVYNTHLRPHQLPPNAKCIYIMRDAMDVMVSFYHHLVHMKEDDGGYTGTAPEFCHDFLDGKIPYGSWEDHMEAWLGLYCHSNNNERNILLLHYHEMKQDLHQQAIRVAKFLNIPNADIDRVLATALPACTFDAMKEERWRYTPQSVSWKDDPQTRQPYDKFVRTGRVGDGIEFIQRVFTPVLYEKWATNQRRAQRRWHNAGIDPAFVDMYLKQPAIQQVRFDDSLISLMKKRYFRLPRSRVNFFFFLLLISVLGCTCHANGVPSPMTAEVIPSSKYTSNKDVFVVVTPPGNSISFSVAEQLYPATIFWILLCTSPSDDDGQNERIQRQLQQKQQQQQLITSGSCHVTFFCPYGTLPEIRAAAVACWQNMTQVLAVVGNQQSDGRDVTEDNNNKAVHDGPYCVRGILFNPYGYVDDEWVVHNGDNQVATSLVHYKLLSTAILIDTLKELATARMRKRDVDAIASSSSSHCLLAFGMRVIAVGSEAARGLPKMGFPVPTLANTYDSMKDFLTRRTSLPKSTLGSSWETIYAQLCAIQVLYFKALASGEMCPGRMTDPTSNHCWYYGVVSPGMTQESLDVRHVPLPDRTLAFRIKMFLCRYILFPILQKMEIAKSVKEAGQYLTAALLGTNDDFDYPNGAFVGAQSGTGGPMCEQTLLEGGRQLADYEIQQLAYQVVQALIQKWRI
jgi:hypothetical protein